MELRTAASPKDVKFYTTERLREEFLIDDLFKPDEIKLVYSHIDRIITGSAVPVKPLRLLRETNCAHSISVKDVSLALSTSENPAKSPSTAKYMK